MGRLQMTYVLIFDTETAGLPQDTLPDDHPAQPHLVQLGALLVDEDGAERASVNLIVRPDGWTIPSATTAAHGITTEAAARVGVPLALAVAAFTNLRGLADELVAHNLPFDEKIMQYAITRVGKTPRSAGPSLRTCTMALAAPVVNLPPTAKMLAAGFNKPKAPSLSECYRHFFGEELAGAHDALVDARACARVYFHLKRMEKAA
jgi:DNA polymerase-3 subunit epsilon